MLKLKNLVAFLMICLLIGMATAEVENYNEDDGEVAWSASVAYNDDGDLAMAVVSATDYETADIVGTTDAEVDAVTDEVSASITDAAATNAASVSASTSATDTIDGSSAGTSIEATGVTSIDLGQAATTTTASQTADNLVTDTVIATTGAIAADGAEAGAIIIASDVGSALTTGEVTQTATATGAAGATNYFEDYGSVDVTAGTYAADGTGNIAGTLTIADSTRAHLIIDQEALADPDAGVAGRAEARQDVTINEMGSAATGSVLSVTGAMGEESGAASGLYAEGNFYGSYNQDAYTDGEVDSATRQAGTLNTDLNSDGMLVLAGTGAATESLVAFNFAATEGTKITFDQRSIANVGVSASSRQYTSIWDGGVTGAIAMNEAGSIAGSTASTDSGYLEVRNQRAYADDVSVSTGQLDILRTPLGTGSADTFVYNAGFPGNYAEAGVTVTEGSIWGSQTASTNNDVASDAQVTQGVGTRTGTTAGSVSTYLAAGDSFGNYAATGTDIVDGTLLTVQGESYAKAGSGYFEAVEEEYSNADSVEQWAEANWVRPHGHDVYVESSIVSTGVTHTEATAFVDLFNRPHIGLEFES